MPRPVLAALLLLAAAACQGTGVPRDEIPADPIAIHYRDPETSRLRADVLKDEQMPRQSRDDLVADVDKVSSYMSKLLGNDDTERDFPGRLALLSPRTGEVELIASARSGAIPVDGSSDRNRLLYAQRISERLQLFELDTSSRRPPPA